MPDGTLLSQGKYRTKIYTSDLPPWFVYGYLYGRFGFISARDVRDLYYRPNYVTNHCFKDDVLFISFQGKIAEEDSTDGFRWFSGYDYALSGDIIESFVRSVKQYSSIDVSEIVEALEQKKEWYYVNCT